VFKHGHKHCLQAGHKQDIKHGRKHLHVRTYGRTNEELLTFSSYLTLSNARGGAAKYA